MGLFKRKRKEEIDLGDYVAISGKRLDEMTAGAVDLILERTADPDTITMGAVKSIGLATAKRWPGAPKPHLELLLDVANLGYRSRQFEDVMDSSQTSTPWLWNEFQRRYDAGEDDTAEEAFAEIAVALCDTTRDDPSSPRGIDAIDPDLSPLRDEVMAKLIYAAGNVAAQRELTKEDGTLPPGIEASDLIAAWRIGFVVRACEQSIPEHWQAEDVTFIAVDAYAARDAAYEWIEEHPEDAEKLDGTDGLMERFLLDERFRVELDDERVGSVEGFVGFELDENGRIVTRDQGE